jgi:D-glycero-D-manno-heptose 1,7-bisphosphate phosphatase
MNRPAVFLDRDGTVIEDTGYLRDPDEVRLVPGAADAIRRLSRAGFLVILVSNQSGVARGLFDEAALARIHNRLEHLLEEGGARLDGAYYCPYLNGPAATVEAYRRETDLRKPAPGMLLKAARELHVDLARSWMVGNAPTDVEAGRRAGCQTILISRDGVPNPSGGPTPRALVRSLAEAAAYIESARRSTSAGPEADTPRDDPVLKVLSQIQTQLERAVRRDRQQDFSRLRLVGALLQMLAVAAALWGAAALLSPDAGSASAKLTLACFLQLASLCAFCLDRFR